MKKLVSAMLALAMLMPLCPTASGGEYETLGHTYENEYELASGLTYKEILSNNDGTVQHAFVFEYESNLGTDIISVAGDSVYGTDKLSELVASAEAQGKYVLGGINGDFFSTKTGVPMGLMISDGVLITNDDGQSAIGMTENGSILVGRAEVSITLDNGNGKIPISYLNKYPSVYNSYLLTNDFAHSSKSATPSKEIIIEVGTVKPRIGQSIKGLVREVRTDAVDTIIPDGCMLISVNNQSEHFSSFDSIEAGQEVQISFDAVSGWEDVEFAIGGSDVIVMNGEVVQGVDDEYHETIANPRTAVGITAQGKLIFYAVDGRNSGMSTGQRLTTMAKTLIELGCVYAMNLDGGGSTTVMARLPGSSSAELQNRPSDGVERKLGNAFLFMGTREASGTPYDLVLYPSNGLVLGGSELDLKAVLRDTSFRTIASDLENNTLKFEVLSGDAEITGDKLTVGIGASDIEIKASAIVDGIEVSGRAYYTSVPTLDSIRFEVGSTPEVSEGGETSLSLIGYYGVVPVLFSPNQVKYTFVDGNGNEFVYDKLELAHDGILKALDGIAHQSAKLRVDYVSADGSVELSNTVDIKVLLKSRLLLDFDSQIKYFDTDVVSGGKHSSKGAHLVGDKLYLSEPLQLDNTAYSISTWVKGNFDGRPYFECVDAKGTTYSVFYSVAEDHSDMGGWVKYEAVIPKNVIQPISLIMPFAVTGTADVIYDDVYANYGAEETTVFADMHGHWASDNVLRAYNMDLVNGENIDGSFYYSPSRNLSRVEFAVMLARFYSLDLDAYSQNELNLTDENEIAPWALPYVRAVVGAGLMRGRDGGDGNVYFAPNDNISRTEAMYVFGQRLDEYQRGREGNVKTSLEVIKEYGNPIMSFADGKSIAAWASDHVGVCVSEGIVTGYSDNTLGGGSYITRAEIAVMFMRLYDSTR